MKNKYIIIAVSILLLSQGLSFAEDQKRKVLYYRNPMNPSITSDVPAKDSMGMDYIPVYAQEQQALPPQATEQKKKIKYWTCGMHPQIKMDKPGNCPICNMKLIPVYGQPAETSEEASGAGVVKLSQRDIDLAGVKSEPVVKRELSKEIRTVGKVAYDPGLYKAEEEFIQALVSADALRKSEISDIKKGSESLIEASRLKLKLMGLNDTQIDELAKSGSPDRGLIISDAQAPYVWVYADIYEYELSWVKPGQQVSVSSISFPDEEFKGVISAMDPVLNPMTRSARVRIKIDNPQLKLKPEMYVDVLIKSAMAPALVVPKDAVLDTGERKIVYIDLGNGSYRAKEVKVGPEAEGFFPVSGGLKEGDLVVTAANFLIDSQSQLSGVASVYGGALGTKEESAERPASGHQH